MTRRLVDVAQDVIIVEEDCGTLRGIEVSSLKNNEEVIESLKDRIVGRTLINDVQVKDEILNAGQIIDERSANLIQDSDTIQSKSDLLLHVKPKRYMFKMLWS